MVFAVINKYTVQSRSSGKKPAGRVLLSSEPGSSKINSDLPMISYSLNLRNQGRREHQQSPPISRVNQEAPLAELQQTS